MNKNPGVPKLYVWENYGLYLGTNHMPLKSYSVTFDQLLLVTEGEIASKNADNESKTFRSLLIRAGSMIDMSRVEIDYAVIAVCYLDPFGQEFNYLQNQMVEFNESFYAHHPQEDFIIETLLSLRDNVVSIEQAQNTFLNLLIPSEHRNELYRGYDERIVKVAKIIRDNIRENLSLEELAKSVHMSESRMRKLFKSELGIPISRYRIGHRVLAGILYLATNDSVTDAALAAGFASTAHFSRCFRALTGIHLTATFLRPPFVDFYIDQAVSSKLFDYA